MKVEVVSSEFIKPSDPTPLSLGRLDLSLFDQLTPAIYTPLLLYYPSGKTSPSVDKIRCLKSSLSLLLVHFYPLAGRIRDQLYIDCNDWGVRFLEADVKCSLSDMLVRPQPLEMKMLLPIDMESEEAGTGPILLVQANSFECGGFALGMCISHKIADMGTFGNFLASWADAAVDITKVEPPLFNASTLIPPSIHLAGMPPVELPKAKTITRRYVFDSSKLTALRTRITSKQVTPPTRVEAVSALLWKCISKASLNLGLGRRKSLFSLAVNLRSRMLPPLPANTFGNLVGSICIGMTVDEVTETDLSELARKFKEEKDSYLENHVKKDLVGEKITMTISASAKAFGELISGEGVDFYNCSPWCGFPLYEADFGWGRPIWASHVSTQFKNSIVMMDQVGGEGIEVWLTLLTDHMNELDKVEGLMEFASLNPSISR
ncbi:hypothetical protein MLD38_002364 [Melastoma candidum]|uniref:Uncharacterized protein n=1 Tax=Melastoma candidum TaxID=119954 RepID=A0ACB9S125_9MYRT|nr:hypothetical protein MLD38_002364 [Melastoma candidum]